MIGYVRSRFASLRRVPRASQTPHCFSVRGDRALWRLVQDPRMGPEVEIPIGARVGRVLRTPHGEDRLIDCTYVRVCDVDGAEIAFWSSDEWREEPKSLGAILGCAIGTDAGQANADA